MDTQSYVASFICYVGKKREVNDGSKVPLDLLMLKLHCIVHIVKRVFKRIQSSKSMFQTL